MTVCGMYCVKGAKIIFDGCRSEELAPAGWVERIHFVSCAGQCSYFAGAPKAPERGERGTPPAGRPLSLILWRVSVYEIDSNSLDTKLLDVGEACKRPSSAVVILRAGIALITSTNVLVECCQNLGGLKGGHVKKTTPDSSTRKAASRKSCDDAKVVGSTFQRAPEIRVSRCRGRGDGAGGEDDVVTDDVGADEAKPWRKEGETTYLQHYVSP